MRKRERAHARQGPGRWPAELAKRKEREKCKEGKRKETGAGRRGRLSARGGREGGSENEEIGCAEIGIVSPDYIVFLDRGETNHNRPCI